MPAERHRRWAVCYRYLYKSGCCWYLTVEMLLPLLLLHLQREAGAQNALQRSTVPSDRKWQMHFGVSCKKILHGFGSWSAVAARGPGAKWCGRTGRPPLWPGWVSFSTHAINPNGYLLIRMMRLFDHNNSINILSCLSISSNTFNTT